MTKSQMFTTAHQIAKTNRSQFSSYREAFSAALKAVWQMVILGQEPEVEPKGLDAETTAAIKAACIKRAKVWGRMFKHFAIMDSRVNTCDLNKKLERAGMMVYGYHASVTIRFWEQIMGIKADAEAAQEIKGLNIDVLSGEVSSSHSTPLSAQMLRSFRSKFATWSNRAH